MGPPDLGPEWFWKLLGFLAALGLVAAVVWSIKGIIWLIRHVSIN